MNLFSGFSTVQPSQLAGLAKQSLRFQQQTPLPSLTLSPADCFALQIPHPSLRNGSATASPNFSDMDTNNPYIVAFNERFNKITAEQAGLTKVGYGTEPNGWESFWFGVDKNLTNIRSKFAGSLRSHDWINNVLPSIQNLQDKTSPSDPFIFSTSTATVKDIQGNAIEIQTPRFCFPKPRSENGRFYIPVLGDPGYNNATLKYNIAAIEGLPKGLKNEEGYDYQWDCLLSMGDNVYAEKDPASPDDAPHNQSGHPDHFYNNIGKACQSFFDEEIPFFTTLGNHEVKNGHQDKLLKYLDLPPYYRLSFGGDTEGKGACVEIFVMNMAWLGLSDAVKLQDKQASSVADAETAIKEQNAWLLTALKDSMETNPKAKRLVVGHYPIFQQNDTIDKPFAKEFRYTIGKVYKALQEENIEEKPTPIDMWWNGHVHKFTVNQSTQLATDEGAVFDLTSPLTQWATGNTAHCEPLGKNEDWCWDRQSAEAKYTDPAIGLDRMQVPCQQITTGFSVMEIDPNEPESPLKLAFIQPPMQPYSLEGKEETGTYWWGQPVQTGEMSLDDAHPDAYKSLYSLIL